MTKYIIIFIFLFSACKKNQISYDVPCDRPTNDITISRSIIIGTWEWVSELRQGRATGLTLITPQTEGYTRQLHVDTEKLEFFRNDTMVEKYRYDFVVMSSLTNFYGDSVNVLTFLQFDTGLRQNRTYFKICNDTLELHYQMYSSIGGLEKWKKK
ncbi:MAG: hypothetical protein EAY72_14070 [Bacteroidetes bacterium]|nr:MAG: hypothetical protein EAY72_14070 [Bacteroidota bacterium]TAE62220.1 MAG: hypothetical protein EAY68_08925 [Bacteroidota bacterium]